MQRLAHRHAARLAWQATSPSALIHIVWVSLRLLLAHAVHTSTLAH